LDSINSDKGDERKTYLETSLHCPNCKEKLSWVWEKNLDTLLICKNNHKFLKVIPFDIKNDPGIIHTNEFDFYIHK